MLFIGGKYTWLGIDKSGVIKMPESALAVLNLQSGMEKCNAKEIHFDIVRCIYKDMCEKYRCPELCAVFCQSDITAFGGYEPKIIFKRIGTMGEGANCCDFHFIRGN